MSIIATEVVADAEGIDDLELELLTAVYTAPSSCSSILHACQNNEECCSDLCVLGLCL